METTVQAFFDRYAAALTGFSPEKIASFYGTPLTIYSDQGIRHVNEMNEIISFWEKGVVPYAEQKIEKAAPFLLTEEQLSETTYTSKVLWRNYNGSGEELSTETNFYILTLMGKELKITGLIIMQL